MIPPAAVERVADALPFLTKVERSVLEDFATKATLATLPAGLDIMAEGERAQAVPILISGEIRVFRTGESGREITLYRFGRGQCCVLSADAILGHHAFPARARVEEASEVALVPAGVFEDWLARSPVWRQFVFEAMAKRLTSLMETLDAVAFKRLDTRVSSLLLERSQAGGNSIRITHQEIADELGSSREVVSRILEDLQSRGLIRLLRGEVEVIERQLLQSSTLM
jgi:CRP/FNR family transcriptional regulator